MIKSKIVDYFGRFTDEEFKEFGKYVNSPYFNSNKKLVSAYAFFKEHYGDFENKAFCKEELYRKVFPGSGYRDSETRKLLSGLTKLAEGYWSQKVYDNDIFGKNINLAGKLISREMISYADKIVARLEEQTSIEKIDGQHFFDNMLRIQVKKKSIELKKESFQTKNFAEDKINVFLLNYFLSFSIKIIQNIRAKQYYNLLSEDTELTKFFQYVQVDKLIEQLSKEKTEYSETVTMYLCIIECLNNGYAKSTYLKFKELLLKNRALYSQSELNNLFTCLQGIQIKRVRENDPEALPEMFDVNNLILKHDAYAFSPGGNMPYSIFVTMITIAISYKKYKWTEEFIEKYTPLLNEKHRQSLYNYAMAELSYNSGNTGAALKYTAKIEYEGFFLKHEVNVLKLKIFYDEGDYIAVQYQLDTYRKLVTGSKFVGEQQYDIYLGFIRIFTELVKTKENNDAAHASLLLKKVKKMNNLQCKEWLLQKAEELS